MKLKNRYKIACMTLALLCSSLCMLAMDASVEPFATSLSADLEEECKKADAQRQSTIAEETDRLFVAVHSNDLPIAQQALLNNANVHALNEHGNTPLHYVKSIEIAKLLVNTQCMGPQHSNSAGNSISLD